MAATNPLSVHGWDKAIIRMNSHIKAHIKQRNPGSILADQPFDKDNLETLASFINSFREETCEEDDVEDT